MTLRDELLGITTDEATNAFESVAAKLRGNAKDVRELTDFEGLMGIGRLAVERVEASADVKHTPGQLATATMAYIMATLTEIAEGREFAVQFPDMPVDPEV